MSDDKKRARQLLRVLASRYGVTLEVERHNPGDGARFKVVPGGADYFEAAAHERPMHSWREVLTYLDGMMEGLAIAQGERSPGASDPPPIVFEGRRWFVVLPDGDTFDTVHGTRFVQVDADSDPQSVAELDAQALVRLPACALLVDLFTGRGKA